MQPSVCEAKRDTLELATGHAGSRDAARSTAQPNDGTIVGMARKGDAKDGGERRKLIAFDPETWIALDLRARDSMSTIQELADEAFGDLLRKHNRAVDLKTALRLSARESLAKAHGAGRARRRKSDDD
jgi:hypothetical protein